MAKANDPVMNFGRKKPPPKERLDKILGYFRNDKKALLDFRMVCKSWKLAVDNIGFLMRELKFRITDIDLFMKSTIVDKVRSIWLPEYLEEDQKKVVSFFQVLGKNVQKVQVGNKCTYSDWGPSTEKKNKFDFDCIDSLTMVCLVLEYFPLLTELSIFETSTKNNEYLTSIPTNAQSLLMIKSLVISTGDKSQSEFDFVKKLMLMLPRLSSIQFVVGSRLNTFALQLILTTLMMEYMEKYQGSLKRIILPENLDADFRDPNWINLMSTCGQYKVDCSVFSTAIDLNIFTNIPFVELSNAKCWPLSGVGRLNLFPITEAGDEHLQTDGIGFCTNLTGLSLVFHRAVMPRELWFLSMLKKIEWLELQNFWVNQLGRPVVSALAFESGFPALRIFHLYGILFDEANIAYSSFANYFPNLQHLYFKRTTDLPQHILIGLSELKNLKVLYLVNCTSLIDTTFVQNVQSDSGPIPVIAAFKILVSLGISECPNLTEICIIRGIALNKNLTKDLGFTPIGLTASSASTAIQRVSSESVTPNAIQALEDSGFQRTTDEICRFEFYRTV